MARRARQPDVRAELRAFSALVLDRAQADPTQQPGRYLVDWHRRLAARLETLPRHPRTNRELLEGALRLHRIHRGLPDPLRDGPPGPVAIGTAAHEAKSDSVLPRASSA